MAANLTGNASTAIFGAASLSSRRCPRLCSSSHRHGGFGVSKVARLHICAAKLPPGVDLPKEEPKLPVAFCGFTNNAELWNARAAMLGIIGITIVEFFLGKGILQFVGIDVGKGLNLPL